MYKTHKSLKLSLALASSVVLAGCQGLSGIPGLGSMMNSGDARLNSKAMSIGSSLFSGCLKGGVLGSLVGLGKTYLSGGNITTAATDLAIGTVSGCIAGATANYYLEQKRQSYASIEEQVNSSIEDVRALNENLVQDIASINAVISEDSAKLARLNKQIKRKSVELSVASAELKKVDENLAQIKKIHTAMKEQHDEFLKVASVYRGAGSKTGSLDKEISKLKKSIANLNKFIAKIEKQRNAIRLG